MAAVNHIPTAEEAKDEQIVQNLKRAARIASVIAGNRSDNPRAHAAAMTCAYWTIVGKS